MPENNQGNPPGFVRVPSGTKGSTANAPSSGSSKFGDPSRDGTHGPSAMVGKDNLGDAPGVVTVPSGTQGDHPTNHPGKPGDADQGHTARRG